jgi:phosphopantetheinyl transferase (holo-ACP synthase)
VLQPQQNPKKRTFDTLAGGGYTQNNFIRRFFHQEELPYIERKQKQLKSHLKDLEYREAQIKKAEEQVIKERNRISCREYNLKLLQKETALCFFNTTKIKKIYQGSNYSNGARRILNKVRKQRKI